MDKVRKFANNMDDFVLEARKVKNKCITMKESRVQKTEKRLKANARYYRKGDLRKCE